MADGGARWGLGEKTVWTTRSRWRRITFDGTQRFLLFFEGSVVQASRARHDIASPDKSDFLGVGPELGLTPVIHRPSVREPDLERDCENRDREHHPTDREPHER
jgi:hypothetical protein